MITYTYGVYRSGLHGKVVLVDLLLPPKKCPLDCAICPLGKSQQLTVEPKFRGPPANKIFKDLEENMPRGFNPDSIMIWGFGDPLVLVNIAETLEGLVHLMRERGLNSKLVIHTSLIQGGPLERILSIVDKLLVPYLWYGDDKHVLGWPFGKHFSTYTELLKHYSRIKRDSLMVELYVFRLGSTHYPSAEHLEETLLYITRTGIENVVVRPLDKPSSARSAKPPTQSHVTMVVEKLVEAGIRAEVDYSLQFSEPLEWDKVAMRLYNQLLRMPLTYEEIRSIYGELGILALSNMISRGNVTIVHWGGKLYYRANL